MSRVHARLTPTDDAVLVEDLGSRNGTFINDQRVEKPTPARHGDRIRFDVAEFTLRDDRLSSSTQPRKPIEDPQGTKVRPAPSKAVVAPVVPDGPENVGRKGGTVIGAVNRDLPKVWISPGGGTVFVPSGDKQAKRDIDVDRLAAEVHEPTLMVFSGDAAGYPYVLKCSGEINFWNIGRDASAYELSIVLDDPSVSALRPSSCDAATGGRSRTRWPREQDLRERRDLCGEVSGVEGPPALWPRRVRVPAAASKPWLEGIGWEICCACSRQAHVPAEVMTPASPGASPAVPDTLFHVDDRQIEKEHLLDGDFIDVTALRSGRLTVLA